MVAEGLSGLMKEAKRCNLFSGYKVDDNGCEVGLLQYADDAIFVGEVNSRNAFTIKVILRDFELVNFADSCGGVIGVPSWEVEKFVDLLYCHMLSFPFVYLGILIGANPRKEHMREPIVQKFSKKLALWKHKSISLAGRVCLRNLILSSLSLFFLW